MNRIHVTLMCLVLAGCAADSYEKSAIVDDPEYEAIEENANGLLRLHYTMTTRVPEQAAKRHASQRLKELCDGAYELVSYRQDTAVTLCEESVEIRLVDVTAKCSDQR